MSSPNYIHSQKQMEVACSILQGTVTDLWSCQLCHGVAFVDLWHPLEPEHRLCQGVRLLCWRCSCNCRLGSLSPLPCCLGIAAHLLLQRKHTDAPQAVSSFMHSLGLQYKRKEGRGGRWW